MRTMDGMGIPTHGVPGTKSSGTDGGPALKTLSAPHCAAPIPHTPAPLSLLLAQFGTLASREGPIWCRRTCTCSSATLNQAECVAFGSSSWRGLAQRGQDADVQDRLQRLLCKASLLPLSPVHLGYEFFFFFFFSANSIPRHMDCNWRARSEFYGIHVPISEPRLLIGEH
jgi:hypothetical protein